MSKRKTWQFRLLTLFLLTAVLAFVLAAVFAFTEPCTGAFLLIPPAVLATVAIHCKGYTRTFCTGALFPMLSALYSQNERIWDFMTAPFEGGLFLHPGGLDPDYLSAIRPEQHGRRQRQVAAEP